MSMYSSKASGLTLASQLEADYVTSVFLDRKATVLKRGQFETYLKGWVAGQSFWRVGPGDLGSPEKMYVVTLNKSIETPNESSDYWNHGSRILTHVEYSNIPKALNR